MENPPSLDDLKKILDQLETTPACDLESEVLDFKRCVPDMKENLRKAVEQVIGFANARSGVGGVVVFGVDDKEKGREAITGCESVNLEAMQGYIFENTRPSLTVQVNELVRTEGRLVVVTVDRDALPEDPLTCVGNTNGRYWIRVGKATLPLIMSEWKGRKRVAASGGSEAAAEQSHCECFPPDDGTEGQADRSALQQERDELIERIKLLSAAAMDESRARAGLRLTQVEHAMVALAQGYRQVDSRWDCPPDCWHWGKTELARLDGGCWKIEDSEVDMPAPVLKELDTAIRTDIFSRFEAWTLYEWVDDDENGEPVMARNEPYCLIGFTARQERYLITSW